MQYRIKASQAAEENRILNFWDLLLQGCQKALATGDISGYFKVFTGLTWSLTVMIRKKVEVSATCVLFVFLLQLQIFLKTLLIANFKLTSQHISEGFINV